MKKTIFLILMSCVCFYTCEKKETKEVITIENPEKDVIIDKLEEVAVIETEFGRIVLEFYPDLAPMHVESFKKLAEGGYFDGTVFHRVIPGFMIQGGDPNSKSEDRSAHGSGGHAGKYFGFGDEKDPDTWTIPKEFSDRPHVRGILSMARTPDENSAGSQFFICVADAHQLDNKYTVFGNVIEGMDIVDQIVNLPRNKRDNPHQRVPINVKIVPIKKALKS